MSTADWSVTIMLSSYTVGDVYKFYWISVLFCCFKLELIVGDWYLSALFFAEKMLSVDFLKLIEDWEGCSGRTCIV